MNFKKILQKKKGSLIMWLDFLFVAVGVGILIVYLLRNQDIIKWLFHK